MSIFHKTKRRAFTIIETLVAITIIMLAVSGPLTAAQRGLATAIVSRDQLIASYLAQDAMEYIHMVRDRNSLEQQFNCFDTGNDTPACKATWSFDRYFGRSGGSAICATACVVETVSQPNPTAAFTAQTGNNDILYVDSTSGYYTHVSTGNTPSVFRRTYTITPKNAYEDVVTVTVSWTNGKTSDSYVLTGNMMDR